MVAMLPIFKRSDIFLAVFHRDIRSLHIQLDLTEDQYFEILNSLHVRMHVSVYHISNFKKKVSKLVF